MRNLIFLIFFSSFSLAQKLDKDLEAFRKVEKEVKNNLGEEIIKINETFLDENFILNDKDGYVI